MHIWNSMFSYTTYIYAFLERSHPEEAASARHPRQMYGNLRQRNATWFSKIQTHAGCLVPAAQRGAPAD